MFGSSQSLSAELADATSVAAKMHVCLEQEVSAKAFPRNNRAGVIIKAVTNAVEKKRIAPLYLFYGPNGTGKTSTAKKNSLALNCRSISHTKPCWSCRGCTRSLYIMELCSGIKIAGFERIKTLLHSTSITWEMPGFKVLIIEDCQLFAVEAWYELLSMVEGSCGSSVVFVLITIDANKVPSVITTRCQKFYFSKLKDKDIRVKLAKIVAHEDIRIKREAMKLIITKSLAENILDQLALLGSTITSSMVQQLVRLSLSLSLSNFEGTVKDMDWKDMI
ncbi:hypothetical protein RJ640_020628 [Escallonia rubra]|uniref:AAA+ ATPase domain-containing protein n=1 Tax=Escallonia rubra TaxID=112253 RepID=A0AA88RS17_9ASTE|nr:hypothetical protein RJ640_020628 [Escallonia rubra]